MATLTIPNLDDALKARPRPRAAAHGRSMEEEARLILHTALAAPNAADTNLVERIQRRFAGFGDVVLIVAPR